MTEEAGAAESPPATAAATFELVDGAALTLSDGSVVTVRDGQLQLSDGRRLPMPAAGEAITVERTVLKPDGSTVRIKHTIRLSEAAPASSPPPQSPQMPPPAAAPQNPTDRGTENRDAADGKTENRDAADEGAGDRGAKDRSIANESVPDGGTDYAKVTPPKVGSDVPTPHKNRAVQPTAAVAEQSPAENNAGVPQPESFVDSDEIDVLPDAPSAAPFEREAIVPQEPAVMGIQCGRRNLRAMLWGSIPEGDDVAIYSGRGSRDEEQDTAEPPPRSLMHPHHSIVEEDESLHEDEEDEREALEASENADESFEFQEGRKSESVNEKMDGNPEPVTKVTILAFDTSSPPEKADATQDRPTDSGRHTDKPQEPESAAKDPSAPTTDHNTKEKETPVKDNTPENPHEHESDHQERPVLTHQDRLPSSTALVTSAASVVIASVGVLSDDDGSAPPPAAESSPGSEVASSPSSDATAPAVSSPSSCEGAGAARHSEAQHELHLKLTPILRSLESEPPVADAGEDIGPERNPTPGEERRGTVPPNTPAVADERDVTSGSSSSDEAETVSVPKVVSYYESISPAKQPSSPLVDGGRRKASQDEPASPPLPAAVKAEPERVTVPKIVNFAVPMQPQKVYLSSQEPEEMESTPIPPPEPARGREQEMARRQAQPVQLVAVRSAPENDAPRQPNQPPPPPHHEQQKQEPEPVQTRQQQQPDPEQQQQTRTYDPTLFEHEPKRPLLLTSEVTVTPAGGDEPSPPYEPDVHQARTLPLHRRQAGPVTEQPPPFGEDERTDPRDPFLPDNPIPGQGKRDDGWIGACLDLCCCCWTP